MNSAHMRGLAADFTAPTFGTVLAVAQQIARSDIEFDQLIHEYGGWVHLGLPNPGKPARRTCLSSVRRTPRYPTDDSALDHRHAL